MRALLIGPGGDECRDVLEAALRREGHDVHVAERAEDARTAWGAAPAPLVVLSRPDEEGMAFCRSLRSGERRGKERRGEETEPGGGEHLAPVVLAVAGREKEQPPRALAEDEAVDRLIFDYRNADRLRAHVLLAQRQAERRGRSEGRLLREGERMRDLFESITDAFIAVDTGWKFTFVNRQAEKLLERRREALLGESLWDAFPEAVGTPFEEHYRQAMQTGEPVSFEAHYAPLGAWFSVNAYPYADGLSIYFNDVTERHQAQADLRESEAKARAVLETTVDGIITIDAAGRIESFNEAAEDIFGYAEGAVQGKNISVLMPEPYRSEHDSYLRNYHETGRRKIIGIGREVEGRRKDGSVFPMDLAVSEVQLGGRQLFTGIVRDISERRHLEREVLQISEEERRRIGQDLHDGLGQMLTGVGLLSRSLARKLKKAGAPGAEEAATIEQLIKDADEQARGLSRGLVPVDLEAKGLADALRRLTKQTERLSEVRCAFREAGTGAVHDNTAATHLFRIAQEATTNAVKHGRASHIAVMLASGGERIRLRVKDDGVGFPTSEAETHESQAGGLGVRTMHHRARLIGASLDIQSTPGEGTSVTCTMRPERGGSASAGHAGGGAPSGRTGAPGCPVH